MKREKRFDVYLHRCRVSGKAYVGITCRGVRQRLYSHESAARHGSSLPFHRAIRKYGIDAFDTTVLATGLTEADAKVAERDWITELKTFGRGGYNATLGGDGTPGLRCSPERRQAISEMFKALPRTEQHRKRVGEALKGREPNWQLIDALAEKRRGRSLPPELADKARAALEKAKTVWSGSKHSGECKRKMRAAKARIIVITRPDGRSTIERTTYRDLAEKHGISHSAIAQAVKLGRVITKQCGLHGCYISNLSHPQLLGMGMAESAKLGRLPC